MPHHDYGTKNQAGALPKKRNKPWRPTLNCEHDLDIRSAGSSTHTHSSQDLSLSSENVAANSNEFENVPRNNMQTKEDALSLEWEDLNELDSLTDKDFPTKRTYTFKLHQKYKDDDSDDWDAVSDIPSVISVDTFDADKQIFSYKDAGPIRKGGT